MHRPTLFKSFFQGGFECSTHRRADGARLDLLAATGHDRWAAQDYSALAHHGIRTVRDGVRWHRIESGQGRYDWSSFLPMLRSANANGVQVVWDLCHYGWPDGIDIWRPEFVDRFAQFARVVAAVVRNESDAVPWYAPVNEISYWAWAGGDEAQFNPLARGRGFELKHQLVRATIAAIDAIRSVDPRARFVQVDPIIHVAPQALRPAAQREAEHFRLAQYEAWDMLAGAQWPGLGGAPEYLDVIGLNYYADNQWVHGGATIPPGDADYRPFRGMLSEVYQRYQRSLLIAETGAEADGRVPWLRYVADEVTAAMDRGIPIEGICLYPITDYPGWVDERYCPVGLLGMPTSLGARPVYMPLADELAALSGAGLRPAVTAFC